MSKATKLFEELGYKDVSYEWYRGWKVFEGEDGFVQFLEEEKEIRVPLTDYEITQLPYKLFIAINEMIKELGWEENEEGGLVNDF